MDGVVAYPGMLPFNILARRNLNVGGDVAPPFPFASVPAVPATVHS